MARLPSRVDLQRRPIPAASGDVRMPVIDYGPQAAGDKAIGAGIESIGGAGQKWAVAEQARQTEVDDYETRKRLLDFKLEAEMDLEERRRQMPVGGGDFSTRWERDFKGRATAFIGPGDANVPEAQREKVGYHLAQIRTQLSERAQRAELGERDRHEVEGLGQSLTRIVDAVSANPDSLAAHRGEGEALVGLSRVSPTAKAKVLTDFKRQTAETAFRERVTRAQAIADPIRRTETIDGLRKDLKAHLEDLPEAGAGGALPGAYADAIKLSEGFTAKAAWDVRQHSIGYGTRARHPGEVIDKPEAERRFAEEIGKAAAIVDRFAPDLDEGTRAALISLTFNAGDAWTRSGLGAAVKAGDMAAARERFLQYDKADGQTNAGLTARRSREVAWIGNGEPRQAPAPRPAGSDDPEAMGAVTAAPQYGVYDGPYQGLTAAQRRKLDRYAGEALRTSLFAQHAEFKAQLDDDVRSRRETGVGRRGLDLELAKRVLTANQFRDYDLRRGAADYEYELGRNIEGMPLQEIRSRLSTMKPADGSEDYGRRSIAYNRTITKVKQLRELRDKDPAGAVDRAPEVERARAIQDPAARPFAIMEARLAKQRAVGIPEQRLSPITREEAQAIAAPLAGYKAEEIDGPLRDLSAKIVKAYGVHAPGVLRMVGRVISQDKTASEIMTGEFERMTREPGMEAYNPRRLREVQGLEALEMNMGGGRGAMAGPAPGAPAGAVRVPAPPGNDAALRHLMRNPHLAPFYDRKYGLAPGTAQKMIERGR